MVLTTQKKLGKKVGKWTVNRYETRGADGVYYSIKTGVSDYLGDEIILTVFPERKLVTDEGYTDFSLSTDRRGYNIMNVKTFIESSGITLTNTYTTHLEITYKDDEWEEAARKLTTCIVDTYAIITK